MFLKKVHFCLGGETGKTARSFWLFMLERRKEGPAKLLKVRLLTHVRIFIWRAAGFDSALRV